MDDPVTFTSKCTSCLIEGAQIHSGLCLSFDTAYFPLLNDEFAVGFTSDKSKRRTKTVKKSLEPKWNQTFVYTHVHRRDFREHMLEITVWDQARMQDEESDFLGEVWKKYWFGFYHYVLLELP